MTVMDPVNLLMVVLGCCCLAVLLGVLVMTICQCERKKSRDLSRV